MASASAVPPPTGPSEASTAAFTRAVHVVFGEWTCLKLAVENEFAGHKTRERALALLKRVLDGLLSTATVHRDELEDLFEAALIDDFNIEAEDESPRQVAELLVTLHGEAKVGQTTTADFLLQRAAEKHQSSWVVVPPPPKTKTDSSDDDCSDSDDEAGGGGRGASAMDADDADGAAKRNEPEVDEDGFQMVPNRRGRGKR